MSGSSGNPTVSNGTVSSVTDPLKRLSSFKTPRDLSLGGIKPNKKVFTPNLNVSRNKNKGPNLLSLTRDHKDDKGRKDRKDRNKNVRNGPNVIKSSGVFSEGMGSAERRSARSSFSSAGGRESEGAPKLQKPFIRVKDVWKIDKELEEQKINKVFGEGAMSDEDVMLDTSHMDKDAPVKLPLSDGGWLHNKPLAAIKVKQEVIVKEEPRDENTPPLTVEQKPIVDVKKEQSEDMDIISLLRSDKPALIMLQFPDTLPGHVASTDEEPARRKQPSGNNATAAPQTEQIDDKPVKEARCCLSGLQEGEVGKLLVHRSGRVCLSLGTTMFEVAAGTQASFRQELVSLGVDEASRTANLISLGALPHKLNLLPHWESMLADITI